MNNLTIKSSSSDLSLTFSEYKNAYLIVQLNASHMKTSCKIYVHQDASDFQYFTHELASHETPWKGVKSWESLEQEIKISASCSSLGKVTFNIHLSIFYAPEPWSLKTDLHYDFGQLKKLNEASQAFFKEI